MTVENVMLTSIQLVLGVMGSGMGDGIISGWFIAEECASWPLPLLPDAILRPFYTRLIALESRFYTSSLSALGFFCDPHFR